MKPSGEGAERVLSRTDNAADAANIQNPTVYSDLLRFCLGGFAHRESRRRLRKTIWRLKLAGEGAERYNFCW